jgi:hypothetical protein
MKMTDQNLVEAALAEARSYRKIHPGAKGTPLPDTIEEALEEILALRSILIREREQHVKLVMKNELDGRSMRGTIARLRADIEVLKASILALERCRNGQLAR